MQASCMQAFCLLHASLLHASLLHASLLPLAFCPTKPTNGLFRAVPYGKNKSAMPERAMKTPITARGVIFSLRKAAIGSTKSGLVELKV